VPHALHSTVHTRPPDTRHQHQCRNFGDAGQSSRGLATQHSSRDTRQPKPNRYTPFPPKTRAAAYTSISIRQPILTSSVPLPHHTARHLPSAASPPFQFTARPPTHPPPQSSPSILHDDAPPHRRLERTFPSLPCSRPLLNPDANTPAQSSPLTVLRPALLLSKLPARAEQSRPRVVRPRTSRQDSRSHQPHDRLAPRAPRDPQLPRAPHGMPADPTSG
jgi:hypothetical protein